MTELSPAAQTVLDAFNGFHDLVNRRLKIAAALEAVADQVVPYLEEPDWGACDEMRCDIELYTDHMRKRSELLAIAAELRGTTTTETLSNLPPGRLYWHCRATIEDYNEYDQGFAALALVAEADAYLSQPEPEGPPLEPRGCPTPGACSCPTSPTVPTELRGQEGSNG